MFKKKEEIMSNLAKLSLADLAGLRNLLKDLTINGKHTLPITETMDLYVGDEISKRFKEIFFTNGQDGETDKSS